ncbi:major facilitator superfamily-domain-containing protein, partial [Syncephalis pseudoplumigaleata]
FGRKPVFLAAIVIFLAGSLGCGAAHNIITLIIMRAIAGIGGGGFVPLVLIIIADIVPPRQRGQYAGIVGAVYAFSSVIGPLLGGLFTDHLTWRWAFYINLPVGAVTILIVIFLLRLKSPVGSMREKLRRIDYLGTLLVLAFCIALLLPVNWGGAIYPWTSPLIISLFCVAAVILALLLWVEHRVAAEPIVPLSLFRSRSICAISIGIFLLGWSFITPIYYLPVFFQAIRGYTATESGLILLPFVLPVSIIVIVSGTVASRIGRWSYRVGAMVVLGVGIGLGIQNSILAAQASVTPDNMAIATALATFFEIIGGVVGLAVNGSVFNNKLMSLLQQYFDDGSLSPMAVQSIETLRHLAEPIRSVAIQAYADALRMQYYVLIPVAGIAGFSYMLVKVLPQQSEPDKRQRTPAMAMH